jgi:hypothetical protein
MKSFIYLSAIVTLFLNSCSKPPVEAKLPASVASLSRSFFYPRTATSESVHYSSNGDSSISKKCFYDSDNDLMISFDVTYAVGNDAVSLTIVKDQIKQGLIGDYVISPFLTPGMPQGDIKAIYAYNKSEYSSTFLMPGMASGVLHITGYNEKQRSISGNYSFRINTSQDPKGGPVVIWEDTQIDVAGTFENVLIK